MNRTAIAAAALAGATALTGAPVSSSAAPSTEASSSAAPSTEANAPHVLKWKWHAIADHEIGSDTIVGTHAIRSQRSNNIMGARLVHRWTPPSPERPEGSGRSPRLRTASLCFAEKRPSAQMPSPAKSCREPASKGIKGTWRLREAPNNPNTILVTVRANY